MMMRTIEEAKIANSECPECGDNIAWRHAPTDIDNPYMECDNTKCHTRVYPEDLGF